MLISWLSLAENMKGERAFSNLQQTHENKKQSQRLRFARAADGPIEWRWAPHQEAYGTNPCVGWHARTSKNASAGNRTRVTSMATMYSTTEPLALLFLMGSAIKGRIYARQQVMLRDLRP